MEKALSNGSLCRECYRIGLQGSKVLVNEGWKTFWRKFNCYYNSHKDKLDTYQQWIKDNEPTNQEICRQRVLEHQFKYRPLISIITPVYNTEPEILKKTILSVIMQTYDNWELNLIDGSPKKEERLNIIKKYSRKDKRIKFKALNKNLGISGNSNEGLAMASGEFIAFLDHDDELAPFALYEAVKLLNTRGDLNIIYSDEDKISESGRREEPFFKPDWSLPMFLSTNYLCHFLICRNSLIDNVNGLRDGFEGAQDYDLTLRMIEKTAFDKIAHIPKILYHWRIIPSSSASGRNAKPYAYVAGKNALNDYLSRNQIKGTAIETEWPGSYRVIKFIEDTPQICVVILSSQWATKFCEYISYLIRETKYKNYTIFIKEVYLKDILEQKNEIEKVKSYEKHSDMLKEDCDYYIFMDAESIDLNTRSNNPNWMEALLENYYYYHAGVVGTGTPIYSNIICCVHRPCGQIFCVRKDILVSYFDSCTCDVQFDKLQMGLADYAESLGYENIYTPYCVGSQVSDLKIRNYYCNMSGNKFFTENMKYYLRNFCGGQS